MASTFRPTMVIAAGMVLALCSAPAQAQDGDDGFNPPAYVGLPEYTPYYEAITRCDEVRFLEAKQQLLAAFERQIAAGPSNAQMREDLLRLQVELLPDPCPPERVASLGTWQPIRDIRFRGSSGRSVRAPNVIELFGAGSAIDVGEAGIGVTRDGPVGSAPDRDAGKTDGKLFLLGGGGAIHLGKLSIFASYLGGDAATVFDLAPIAGGFNGAVFGELSPAGSSGIGAGSASLSGRTHTDMSRFRFGADYEILGPTPRSRVFFAFDYFRDSIDRSMDQTGTVVFPTSTITFEQARRQSVTDNVFAAGFGGETLIPLTPPRPSGTGLSLRMGGTAQGYILDTNFFSTEHNRSNFGPASDRDFVIEFEQEDQSLGLHVRGQLNLEYVASPRLALFAGATAEWFSDGGGVHNPSSGTDVQDGATTGLRRLERCSYGGVVGARFRL